VRARGQARVGPPPTVGFGDVHGHRDIHQAGRDINRVEHHHNAPDYYEHAKRFCSLAIAAMLLAVMFWPAALPVGYAARRRIRRTGEGGGGLTTAALAISWSMFFVTTLAVGAFVVMEQGFVTRGGPSVPFAEHAAVRDLRIRITDGPNWPEFVPGSATLGPGSTITWVNDRDQKCRLVATNDELPAGDGANPLRHGDTYTITFTDPGLYGFACDGEFASGGTVVVQ
jgi:plastocyanin